MSGNGSVVMEQVWKEYRRDRSDDTIRGAIGALTRRLIGARTAADSRAFWAVRDVSFEVTPGRVLGIIGSNGAGKSTILKLLTRIVTPTSGRVAVRGRVGALVELAAGFHPELTGRENIFLQGALLGMSRRELAQRLDDIVAFAEVADFIDTPVKRYSSGMHARLGFSVAAHLAPDVLLIDEVLAVGDHRFQRRAFDRVKSLVASGAAVVVISHQLERVVELADEAILLSAGTVVARGRPVDCVAAYVDGARADTPDAASLPYELTALTTTTADTLASGQTLALRMRVRATGSDATDAVLGVRLWTVAGEQVVAATNTRASGLTLPAEGPFALDIALQMNVGPGLYRAQAVVWRISDGAEWFRGPSLVVRVEASSRSFGPVFVDPVIRLDHD